MNTVLQPLAQVDEISPIVAYILKEMASNAGGRDALQMRGLNTIADTDCGAEAPLWMQLLNAPTLRVWAYTTLSARSFAYARWAMQVRQNGPWDHKPHIGKKFPAQRPYHHHYHGRPYYYDIWSNIHYGYVGRACGFTRGELLDGAGLEQIGSTLLRGGWPTEDPGTKGMRRFDDPSDRRSIQIGIDLYPQLPSIPIFLQILEKTPGLSP